MPRVYNGTYVIAEVDGDLLTDFFHEYYNEGKTLREVLAQYEPEVAETLSQYIVSRLAETDPGYVPEIV